MCLTRRFFEARGPFVRGGYRRCRAGVVVPLRLLLRLASRNRKGELSTTAATHGGSRKTGFVSRNWWLVTGWCPRLSMATKERSESRNTGGAQGLLFDCIGLQLRRESTYCAAGPGRWQDICKRSRVRGRCRGRYRITRNGERSRILGYGQLRVLTLLHAGFPFLQRS